MTKPSDAYDEVRRLFSGDLRLDSAPKVLSSTDASSRQAEAVLASGSIARLGEIQRLDGGAGLSVVGCELPEVYTLKREYESLMPNRLGEIKSITKKVWLVDEFVLRVVNLEKSPGSFVSTTMNA
jgi:hypothetical protein